MEEGNEGFFLMHEVDILDVCVRKNNRIVYSGFIFLVNLLKVLVPHN